MSAYGASPVNRRRSTRGELAELADAIVAAVEADKPVTLRGVFYRVVSAGAVDKTELGYRQVGRVLLQLRRTGVIDYGDITDGTRWIVAPETWDSVDAMLADAAATYRRDLWRNQDVAVYVFTEKDAISGVIAPVTDSWDVPRGVLRGYSSESFAWSVAQHVEAEAEQGKEWVWLYQLGDHDPSGVDAWRAFTERVTGFLSFGNVMFSRLAVTPDQIAEFDLPTRPTKRTDSRAAGFDGDSVEVDAIPAPLLRQIVEDAITGHIDGTAWRITQEAEATERRILRRISDGWQ